MVRSDHARRAICRARRNDGRTRVLDRRGRAANSNYEVDRVDGAANRDG